MKIKHAFNKFLILWSGEFISAIGSGLSTFGIGVYIYKLTGSATAMSMVTLLGLLPPLLLSPLAGVLADRYDRRLLMILGDFLSVFGLIYIFICLKLGNIELWQIYIGISISSIFSSLMQPAFRATITDLLSKEEFTKASGLVQVTDSAKYLISPVIAGFIMASSDLSVILLLDISTFFITVLTTLVVRKNCKPHKYTSDKKEFLKDFKVGFSVLKSKKGLISLTITVTIMCLFMGVIQVLSGPMVLSFSSEATYGTLETVIASGMLVSSVLIGVIKIKKNYTRIMAIGLFISGLTMIGMGAQENTLFIGIFGFFFFASLPFANSTLDYLIRTNVDNSVQGRVWSLISIFSQLGYVVSYSLSGVLADYVANPLLQTNKFMHESIGSIIGVGPGRGEALIIIISGIILAITAISIALNKSIKSLEKE